MVNLSRALMMPRHYNNVRNDGYWRRRQILMMSAHFYGRSRNCFSIAIRRVQRALQYVSVGRKIRKLWVRELWENRISAASEELGHIPNEPNKASNIMLESLARSKVLLNRQSLANLAVWEPRTFKAINAIAADTARTENITREWELGPPPTTIKGKLPSSD